MRSLRSSVVLLSLCLALVASVASAADGLSIQAGRDSGGLAGLFQQWGMFLTAIWEKTGCDIDPLGRCAAEGGAPVDGAPDTYAGHIDPLGGESTLTVDGGCEIDPLGRCGGR